MPKRIRDWARTTADLVVRHGTGWKPYAVATLAVGVATLVRAGLQDIIGPRVFFITVFPAIALAAAFGGILPGLLALGLSLLAVAFFFLPPQFSFALSEMDVLQLGLFALSALPLVAVASILNVAIHLLSRQQQEIRRAHAREARQQELMVKELDHRIGNLFGLVNVLAVRTFREDLPIAEARRVFAARVIALRAASGLVTDDLMVDRLLDRHIDPFQGQFDVHRCSAIHLSPAGAQQLSLIFHELTTNAAKYGALSTRTGRVTVICGVEGPATEANFIFTWIETGGPLVTPPTRKGFGTEVLRATPESSGATVKVEYEPAGLRYTYVQRLSRLSSA